MVNIKTTYPLELVCMDYLSLEPDSRDNRNILVITDHFMKFVVAVPTKDQKAKTVARALWENFLVHYGFTSPLHSDQGRDFESYTIRELCSLIGAEKVRTTPYHPQGNPVERYNRTLLSMLGTWEDKDKQHWIEFVKPLVHAYNYARNDTTGYSPYELMFGRQPPTLPVDLILGTNPPTETHMTHSEYVQNLRQRLNDSYTLAAENSKKAGERNKLRFDAKVRAVELVEGDCVLVRNVSVRGKHKRAVHVVVRRIECCEFNSQHSLTSKQLSSDQPAKPTDPPFAHSRDHVVVDIPDCDTLEEGGGIHSPVHQESEMVPSDLQHDLAPQGPEEDTNVIERHLSPEPRRSNRERRVPRKFTYDELGKPLILALNSFFESLQDVMTPMSWSSYQVPCSF